ncbi:hypothetical protein CHRY9390_02256 [Chryseobacterium aquaeductus]|uniref:Uncharacterized protein n=1 Tax=Chryseobacterium aquaeductus TaxID=2675056 RepID=A0A9N8MPA2_9FLAO|nr:hypothetical protein CHRY9390_02256 [Chryseobacterium potabilaquae]CAD7810886.1 hypothetical protein CHRY9390_02256 [Chryseobacterium aquaeductus]
MNITLEQAQKAIEAAIEKSKEMNLYIILNIRITD